MSQYFLFQFRIIILCFFKMSLINQLQTTNYWALIALLNVCNNLDYDSKLSLANGHSLEHSFEYKIIYSLNVSTKMGLITSLIFLEDRKTH